MQQGNSDVYNEPSTHLSPQGVALSWVDHSFLFGMPPKSSISFYSVVLHIQSETTLSIFY